MSYGARPMSSPTSWNLSPRSAAIRPSVRLRANRTISRRESCSARPRRRRGTMTTISTIERDAATPPAWLSHVQSRTSPPDLTTTEGRLARVALFGAAISPWDSNAGLISISARHTSTLSGIVGPTHWQRTGRLIEAERPNKRHGLRSSTARRSTPARKTQRHEPSREALAVFAYAASPYFAASQALACSKINLLHEPTI
jgi:hypothetical protein